MARSVAPLSTEADDSYCEPLLFDLFWRRPLKVDETLDSAVRARYRRPYMVTMKQIEELSQKLVQEFRPLKVVLFGSYAKGIVTPDSDVDLLVILPFGGKSVSKSVEMRLKLRPKFPVDLIVRTPEKVRERLEMDDAFMQEVMEEGKILYEAHNR